MTWNNIPDASLLPGEPLKEELGQNLNENNTAFADQDIGAPVPKIDKALKLQTKCPGALMAAVPGNSLRLETYLFPELPFKGTFESGVPLSVPAAASDFPVWTNVSGQRRLEYDNGTATCIILQPIPGISDNAGGKQARVGINFILKADYTRVSGSGPVRVAMQFITLNNAGAITTQIDWEDLCIMLDEGSGQKGLVWRATGIELSDWRESPNLDPNFARFGFRFKVLNDSNGQVDFVNFNCLCWG